MAENSRHVRAAAHDVFTVLADGWRYSNWVVGTSHMRAVEAEWPAVGARLFHAAGAWPLATRDHTEVRSVEPDVRLELIAHGQRFGTAHIVLELEPEPDGCRVTLIENPIAGMGKWLDSPLTQALLHRRNEEALARLAAVSERRTEPGD